MTFRRPGEEFKASAHYQAYLTFMNRQRNASEAVGVLRGGASGSAQSVFLRFERALTALPDRVGRTLFKQLLRRSLLRLRTLYRANWLTHPVERGSAQGYPSVRKATQRSLQSIADTRGYRTKAVVGHQMRLKPRARIATLLDKGRANWRIQEKTAAQIPMQAVLDDLALVIERDFVDLARAKGLKAHL